MPEPIVITLDVAGDSYPVPLDRRCPDCGGRGCREDGDVLRSCPRCGWRGTEPTAAGNAVLAMVGRYLDVRPRT